MNHSANSQKIVSSACRLAIFAGLALRVLFPLADPPSDLSWSGGYFADEGFWVHDARNIALFGAAGIDEWQNRFVSPPSHFLSTIMFAIFRPGLLSVRLSAQMLSLLSVLLLWVALRKTAWGEAAVGLFAASCLLSAYQRIAILENYVIPIVIMILLLNSNPDRRRSTTLDFSLGLLSALAYFTKGTQLFLIPAVLVTTVLQSPSIRDAVRRVTAQICGILAPTACYYCFIFHPHQNLIRQYQGFYASQHGETVADFIGNLATQPFMFYFNRIALVFSLSWLALGETVLNVHRFRIHFRKIPPMIQFCLIWSAFGLLSLAPLRYRPLRYYVPILIPMVCIAAWRLHALLTDRDIGTPAAMHANRVLLAVWMSIPLMANAAPVIDHLLFRDRLIGIFTLPGYALPSSIWLSSLSVLLILSTLGGIPRKLMIPLLSASLAATFILDLGHTSLWHVRRQYSILDAAEDIARRLPPGSVVGGQWAPELCLESSLAAVPIWRGFVNWDRPFARFGITHMLSWVYPLGNELEHQRNWFPDEMKDAVELTRYSIKGTPVVLWEIARDPTR